MNKKAASQLRSAILAFMQLLAMAQVILWGIIKLRIFKEGAWAYSSLP
jgi:hypothetical protein